MTVIAGETTVEWAPFVKAEGVTDQQLVAAATVVNSDFLILQKGFIKRDLVKKNSHEYADIIYWVSKTDAISAGGKVSSCVQCGEYFKLMKVDAKTGGEFSHYIILKSW